MKRSKFTEQQIAFAPQQAETGTQVDDVCRKMGISGSDVLSLEATLWRLEAIRGEEATAARGRERQAAQGCSRFGDAAGR
jgi:hypothetical protein